MPANPLQGPIFGLGAILKHHELLAGQVFTSVSESFREINTNPQGDAWKKNQYTGRADLYAWSKDS